MKKKEVILRAVIAILAGEAFLVLGTTVAQEVLVDGVSWNDSSRGDLLIGGVGSIVAAILSGMLAHLIIKRHNLIPLIVLSVFVVAETTWLILTGRTTDPDWFTMAAGAGLIAGFWIGRAVLNALVRS